MAVASSYSLALAQLIAYIKEIQSVSQISSVLADLVRMFGDGLRQLGCQSENPINSTQLKEKMCIRWCACTGTRLRYHTHHQCCIRRCNDEGVCYRL